MQKFLNLLASNIFVKLVIIAIILDSFLGASRAIKEKKFNSCIGIDGAIRKICMIGCIVFLMLVDVCTNFNFLFMLPQQYIDFLGIEKLGICEFFSILFLLYETVSILKNMVLCGLPVPIKIRKYVENLLNNMTNELEYKEVK